VAYVHTKLKPLKPIGQQLLPEFGMELLILFGVRWQIVHDYYPHNSISIKTGE
jgi:hypothetical protein